MCPVIIWLRFLFLVLFFGFMGRHKRITLGGIVYHVMNRANG